MYFYLSKLLTDILFPPGFTLALLLFATVLRKSRPRLALTLALVAILSLWTLSTPAVAEALLRGLETQYPTLTPDQAAPADAIIVLGGYLHTPGPGHASIELNEAGDRLWMGAQLFRAGKAPWVLLTGGTVPLFEHHPPPESLAARTLLHDWGVPLDAIEVETESRNTHENATLSKPILARKNAHRLLLVTSAFHMPRAVAIFQRAGLAVTPVPTDYLSGWDHADPFLALLPDSESLYRSSLALREWIGLAAYRLRGWA